MCLANFWYVYFNQSQKYFILKIYNLNINKIQDKDAKGTNKKIGYSLREHPENLMNNFDQDTLKTRLLVVRWVQLGTVTFYKTCHAPSPKTVASFTSSTLFTDLLSLSRGWTNSQYCGPYPGAATTPTSRHSITSKKASISTSVIWGCELKRTCWEESLIHGKMVQDSSAGQRLVHLPWWPGKRQKINYGNFDETNAKNLSKNWSDSFSLSSCIDFTVIFCV